MRMHATWSVVEKEHALWAERHQREWGDPWPAGWDSNKKWWGGGGGAGTGGGGAEKGGKGGPGPP